MCQIKKIIIGLVILGPAVPARAQLLDTLLPQDIPGYGNPFSVTAARRTFATGATGWDLDGISAAPSVALTSGYDSAPGGAKASPVFTANPSLTLADPAAGFGLTAQISASAYPGDSVQNNSTTLLATGERINLPRQEIILGAAFMRGAATGFAFDTTNITSPLLFTREDFRARDKITDGLFTLTPDIEVSQYRFSGLAIAANRREQREGVTLACLPGVPITTLIRLHATQLRYVLGRENADIYEALAGVKDQADGLWTISLLAGAAQRQPRQGKNLTTPVVEARADWSPDMLDQVSLTFRREVDDPDAISASPYILTSINLAISHEYLENVTFKVLADLRSASYVHSELHEYLATGELEMRWQAAPALALDANYSFNSRQANNLRAANEHVLTIGAVWTP